MDETPRGHCMRVAARMRQETGRNPSKTRPPAAGQDLDLWPSWTRNPITLAFTLLDEDGTPIVWGGGR